MVPDLTVIRTRASRTALVASLPQTAFGPHPVGPGASSPAAAAHAAADATGGTVATAAGVRTLGVAGAAQCGITARVAAAASVPRARRPVAAGCGGVWKGVIER